MPSHTLKEQAKSNKANMKPVESDTSTQGKPAHTTSTKAGSAPVPSMKNGFRQ